MPDIELTVQLSRYRRTANQDWDSLRLPGGIPVLNDDVTDTSLGATYLLHCV